MFALIVVVTANEDTQVTRMQAMRAMDEAAARARIASQASAGDREAIADVVIVNDGSLEQLQAEVGRLWTLLEAKRGG